MFRPMGHRPLYHQEIGLTYKPGPHSCPGVDRTGRGARAREGDPDERHVAGQVRLPLGSTNATWLAYTALITQKL